MSAQFQGLFNRLSATHACTLRVFLVALEGGDHGGERKDCDRHQEAKPDA